MSRIEYNILINAKDNTLNVDIYEQKGMVSGYKTKWKTARFFIVLYMCTLALYVGVGIPP